MKLLPYTISPAVVLLLWEILAYYAIIDTRFFPSPSAIFNYLFYTAPQEGLWNDLQASLSRIAWGYTLGSFCGVALGIIMSLWQPARIIAYPLVALTYPLPKIALLPLIMLIFGLGELSKIIIVAIGSFFLVLINTLNGTDHIDKIYREIAFVYKIKPLNFVFRIAIPAALPSIFTGLKLAVGYSLVIVVAAEFSGADAGIGYRIWQSWETFSIKAMYSSIFIIGLLGFIFSFIINLLERFFIPWKDFKK